MVVWIQNDVQTQFCTLDEVGLSCIRSGDVWKSGRKSSTDSDTIRDMCERIISIPSIYGLICTRDDVDAYWYDGGSVGTSVWKCITMCVGECLYYGSDVGLSGSRCVYILVHSSSSVVDCGIQFAGMGVRMHAFMCADSRRWRYSCVEGVPFHMCRRSVVVGRRSVGSGSLLWTSTSDNLIHLCATLIYDMYYDSSWRLCSNDVVDAYAYGCMIVSRRWRIGMHRRRVESAMVIVVVMVLGWNCTSGGLVHTTQDSKRETHTSTSSECTCVMGGYVYVCVDDCSSRCRWDARRCTGINCMLMYLLFTWILYPLPSTSPHAELSNATTGSWIRYQLVSPDLAEIEGQLISLDLTVFETANRLHRFQPLFSLSSGLDQIHYFQTHKCSGSFRKHISLFSREKRPKKGTVSLLAMNSCPKKSGGEQNQSSWNNAVTAPTDLVSSKR
jgi:hypothetical protein